MTHPAIKLNDVSKFYGKQISVDGLNCELPAGSFIGLLGHNGAGKSTLIKMLLRLIHPDRGTIEYCVGGQYQTSLPHRIGYLPENINFPPNISGREALHFYAKLKSISPREAEYWLKKVGLAVFGNRLIKHYSKGMKQRLGLAQALLGKPNFLFLDEPTNGFDPELRLGFYEMLHEIHDKETLILFCTHLLSELENQTSHLLILKQGKMVAYDKTPNFSKKISHHHFIKVAFENEINPIVKRQLKEIATKFNGAIKDEAANKFTLALPAPSKIACLDALWKKYQRQIADINIQPPSVHDIYQHYNQEGENDAG